MLCVRSWSEAPRARAAIEWVAGTSTWNASEAWHPGG